MRWTIDELFYELDKDPGRRILFVEGDRDLIFWRDIVPVNERGDSVVYEARQVYVPDVSGGERGRLIALATTFDGSAYRDRVLFFIDADWDRIRSRVHPSNIVLTDGRDLESYVINEVCIDRICTTGLGKTSLSSETVLRDLITLGFPLAILRITSHLENLDLPFARTLERSPLRRWISRPTQDLDSDKLLRALIQNSEGSLKELASIREKTEENARAFSELAADQILHGKDVASILAYRLEIEESEAEHLLFMAIALNLNSIRKKRNIAQVEGWVRPMQAGIASSIKPDTAG